MVSGALKEGPWVVIVGSPMSGFTYHGPYADWDDAERFGESVVGEREFWIAPLQTHINATPTLVVDNK